MRKVLIFIGLILLITAATGLWAYNAIFSNNVAATSEVEIYIPTHADIDQVMDSLTANKVLKDESSFRRVSSWMKYGPANVPSGRYIITPGMSNKALISKLRSGDQKAVNLIFHTARTMEDLAGDLSSRLELDSLALLDALNNKESYESRGFNKQSFMSMFIPNTYQVFWNITADELMDRMKQEHNKFWSSDKRKARLKALNMTPEEVYALASIVENESANKPERPIIAGLYLNRLERGIPLQADPTVIYAVGDFTLRRVLNRHLAVDNPYNTYMYPGLPPGPISLASINAIDAVLQADDNSYIYMCAKPGYNSEHAFARTLSEHNRNADIYRRWLNKEGIR